MTEELFMDISRDKLVISPLNVRKCGLKEENGLRESIEAVGIIEPLIVRPTDELETLEDQEKYEIVVGQRRFLESNSQKLPCKVKVMSDQEAIEMSLVENLQRKDVDSIDIAEGLKKLYDIRLVSDSQLSVHQFALDISKHIGMDESQVRRYLSLVNLTPELKEMVSEGKITIESGSKLKQIEEDQQKEFVEEFSKLLEEKPITQLDEEDIIKDVKEHPDKIKEIINEKKEELSPDYVRITLNFGSGNAEFRMRKKYYNYLSEHAQIMKKSPLSLLEEILIEKLKEWGYRI